MIKNYVRVISEVWKPAKGTVGAQRLMTVKVETEGDVYVTFDQNTQHCFLSRDEFVQFVDDLVTIKNGMQATAGGNMHPEGGHRTPQDTTFQKDDPPTKPSTGGEGIHDGDGGIRGSSPSHFVFSAVDGTPFPVHAGNIDRQRLADWFARCSIVVDGLPVVQLFGGKPMQPTDAAWYISDLVHRHRFAGLNPAGDDAATKAAVALDQSVSTPLSDLTDALCRLGDRMGMVYMPYAGWKTPVAMAEQIVKANSEHRKDY